MVEVAILVPSRGRPDKLREMVNAAKSLASEEIHILCGIDRDDKYIKDYDTVTGVTHCVDDRMGLREWTNVLARYVLQENPDIKYLVSMGDDHMVRTVDWDKKLKEAIQGMGEPGFSFGDDDINGSNLCTSWMVSVEIVKAIGWMMLPWLDHMYVDNAIMELGNAANRIVYCPDVRIEHMHPTAKKSNWDTTYLESSTDEQYAKDKKAFNRWRFSTFFEQDVLRVKQTHGLEQR
jgi:hypothetical protein